MLVPVSSSPPGGGRVPPTLPDRLPCFGSVGRLQLSGNGLRRASFLARFPDQILDQRYTQTKSPAPSGPRVSRLPKPVPLAPGTCLLTCPAAPPLVPAALCVQCVMTLTCLLINETLRLSCNSGPPASESGRSPHLLSDWDGSGILMCTHSLVGRTWKGGQRGVF